MELKRLRIHPLFFALGILSAFTGGLFEFCLAVLAALQHECAHALVARRFGFGINGIVLMPYGAVACGDFGGMKKSQAALVLLAGPAANGLTALLFVALWWLFPESYPYTEEAAKLSLSLCIVNLLPALPLDGGRLLGLLLSPLKKKRAKLLLALFSFLTAGMVLTFFVFSCFTRPAWTALAFSLLLAVGAAESLSGRYAYRPIALVRRRALARGIEEKRVVISADCTLSEALRHLSEERYLVLVLYRGEEFLGELPEEDFLAALQAGDYQRPLENFI